MLQLMHQDKVDENYHWPILKFDNELKKVVGEWGPGMTTASEPRFVANPDGKDEEDGLIFTTSYDFNRKESSIVVLDPKSMTTLQQYKLPFKLAIQFHNNYWTYKDLETGGRKAT